MQSHNQDILFYSIDLHDFSITIHMRCPQQNSSFNSIKHQNWILPIQMQSNIQDIYSINMPE